MLDCVILVDQPSHMLYVLCATLNRHVVVISTSRMMNVYACLLYCIQQVLFGQVTDSTMLYPIKGIPVAKVMVKGIQVIIQSTEIKHRLMRVFWVDWVSV